MQEIIIFIITSSLIIILVELFTYLRKGNKKRKSQKDKDKDKDKDNKDKSYGEFTVKKDTELTGSLNKYSTNSDIQVEHLPGKFYIENPDNIFIKIKDRIIIPEHKIIYNLEENFTLDIINLKKEKIFYYYK